MVPGDMYQWSWGIFAKKSKLHDGGGPDTVVSPIKTFIFEEFLIVMIQHKIILGTDLFHLNAIVCYTKLVNINFDKYFTCFIALLWWSIAAPWPAPVLQCRLGVLLQLKYQRGNRAAPVLVLLLSTLGCHQPPRQICERCLTMVVFFRCPASFK